MTARVFHAELWGLRELWEPNARGEQELVGGKYYWLLSHDIETTGWTSIQPQPPFYLFKPLDTVLASEYGAGWKVTDIFPVNSVGIVTARDALTIRWSEEEMWNIVRDFVKLPEHEAREKYGLGDDAQDWTVERAQKDVKESGPKLGSVVSILYRPFDARCTYYTGQARGFLCRPRSEVMRHMMAGENTGLVAARQQSQPAQWALAGAANAIIESCYISNKTKEINYLFPLYIYPDPNENGDLFANGAERHVNLNPEFLELMGKDLRLSFVAEGTGDLKRTFGPEDVLHYVYAVFHSPTYRERYAEFLKIDFPRVPVTSNRKQLRRLCALGTEMISLHLLEADILSQVVFKVGKIDDRLRISYPAPGDDLVAKGHPRYVPPGEPEPGTGKPLAKGRVYINPDDATSGKKGQYFEGVPPHVWAFHVGGYQVCEKWLKDRRGRKLSYDDLTHYQKVVVALNETTRLMEEIDAAIPDWPIR